MFSRSFWLRRLKEPSTYAGLVGIATFFGATISPELKDAIVQAGVALAGLLLIFTRESGDVRAKDAEDAQKRADEPWRDPDLRSEGDRVRDALGVRQPAAVPPRDPRSI
jgi:hypothetical protein